MSKNGQSEKKTLYIVKEISTKDFLDLEELSCCNNNWTKYTNEKLKWNHIKELKISRNDLEKDNQFMIKYDLK